MLFIEIVLNSLGGREFLVNLAEAVEEDALPPDVLASFVSDVEEKLASHPSSTPEERADLRQEIIDLVYNPSPDASGRPRNFSYLAKVADCTEKRVLSFLTWQKLVRLIPEHGSLGAEIRTIVDKKYFGDGGSRPPFVYEMEAVAEAVNKLGPAEADFRVSSTGKDGNAYAFWITFCDDFEAFGGLSADDLAARMRDWLGLGHFASGAPIFAFRSTQPLPPTRARPLIGRPTIFDGIDSGYFKHRFEGDCPDKWGRTLDLAKASCDVEICDGGPEAVTPGPRFGSLFECLFVGHVRSSAMPVKPRVLEVLLRQSSVSSNKFEDVTDRLNSRLTNL